MEFFMNEAALVLPGVKRIVDRTVHEVDIVVEDGVELQFAVTRTPLDPGEGPLEEQLGVLMAARERSLRGFVVLSLEQRAYAHVAGIEVRLRFRGEAGLLFQHQLHCAVESATGKTWLAFHCQAPLESAEACDRWMAEALESVRFAGG